MNVTHQAAVHLGRDYMENLQFTKNQVLKSLKQLFQVTERLIKGQTEISGVTTIDYENSLRGGRRLYYVAKLLITNAKT